MLKRNPVQVSLNDDDDRDLNALVKLEREDRKDPTVGAGTLLREYSMPLVRKRLTELQSKQAEAAARELVPRGPDRRATARKA